MNYPSIEAADLINAQKNMISDLQHQILILQLTVKKLQELTKESAKE